MNILDLLKIGGRKEIGESKNIAKLLVSNKKHMDDFFELLLMNSFDPAVVSHGCYALKEASIVDKEIAKKSRKFLFKNIDKFDQWEAKENLLRIVLLDKNNIKLNIKELSKVENFLMSKSSIVSTCSVEVLIRYKLKKQSPSLIETIEWGLTHNRAAVKARTRNLISELKIQDIISF